MYGLHWTQIFQDISDTTQEQLRTEGNRKTVQTVGCLAEASPET